MIIALDEMASAILASLVTASWKGTVVIALVIAVQALGGSRLPASWRYAFWLLAAVRLVLPYGPANPVGQVAPPAVLESLPLVALGLGEDSGPTAQRAPAEGSGGRPSSSTLLIIVWTAGLLACALRYRQDRRRLRRLLRAARPIEDPQLSDLFDRCRKRLGIERPVALLQSQDLAGAAIFPGRRPAVLLPARPKKALDPEDMTFVLLHELAHLERRDAWSELAIRVLAAIHWFNPIVHFAARRAREDREAACDSRVLALLSAHDRRGYGRCLIRVASRNPFSSPQPGLVGIAAGPQQLKRRIKMIARFRVGTPQRTLAFFAILASFALFSWTDLTASPSPSPTDLRASSSADDAEKLRLTVEATRTAGVAIYRRAVDFWGEGQVDAWHEQRRAQANGDETSSIDWSACSPIRYEELRELLVPAFIDELPAMDGWNHPLEFCLVEAADPSRAHLMGVRSPGRDGAFSGDLYPVGAFPRNDIDRDVVWMDGFYYTWPQQE